MRRNCFFWVNSLIVALAFFVSLFAVENIFEFTFVFTATIIILLLVLLATLVVVYAEEYLIEFKKEIKHMKKNWGFFVNSLAILNLLVLILFLFQWRINLSSEIKYLFFILGLDLLYVFLFIKKTEILVIDIMENSVKYLFFLSAFFFYMLLLNLAYFTNTIQYQQMKQVFYYDNDLYLLAGFLVTFLFLFFIIGYLYLLIKKIKILIEQIFTKPKTRRTVF
jgi:hypothetical protein